MFHFRELHAFPFSLLPKIHPLHAFRSFAAVICVLAELNINWSGMLHDQMNNWKIERKVNRESHLKPIETA